MEDRLAMMYECSNEIASIHIPHSDSGVATAGNNNPLVVLQTQNGPRVSRQDPLASQRISIPHFDSVIS